MKLEDLINLHPGIIPKEAKGFHVIGTCKDCKHYDPSITQIDQENCAKRIDFWWPDDGCIHWTIND